MRSHLNELLENGFSIALHILIGRDGRSYNVIFCHTFEFIDGLNEIHILEQQTLLCIFTKQCQSFRIVKHFVHFQQIVILDSFYSIEG